MTNILTRKEIEELWIKTEEGRIVGTLTTNTVLVQRTLQLAQLAAQKGQSKLLSINGTERKMAETIAKSIPQATISYIEWAIRSAQMGIIMGKKEVTEKRDEVWKKFACHVIMGIQLSAKDTLWIADGTTLVDAILSWSGLPHEEYQKIAEMSFTEIRKSLKEAGVEI